MLKFKPKKQAKILCTPVTTQFSFCPPYYLKHSFLAFVIYSTFDVYFFILLSLLEMCILSIFQNVFLYFIYFLKFIASLVAQWQGICLSMKVTWVRSLGQEDTLQKEMVTHSSILAWEIPWTEEPGGLQSMGSQKSRTRLSN